MGERLPSSCAKNIFLDELDNPSAHNDDNDAASDYGFCFCMLQDLDEPTTESEIQSQEDQEIYHQNIFNDFNDIGEIPQYSQRNDAIFTRRNGKQAYMSKCKTVL